MRLADLAKVIRSKNAGPFELTFDVLFDSEEAYVRVVDSVGFERTILLRFMGSRRGMYCRLLSLPLPWQLKSPFGALLGQETWARRMCTVRSSMHPCWMSRFPR